MGNLIYPQGSIGSAKGNIGLSYVTFFDDFVGSSLTEDTADVSTWLSTNAGTGIAAAPTLTDNGNTGEIALTTATNADNESSIQLNGGAFQLNVGKRLYWEARVKVSEIGADNDDLFGLMPADTTPIATSAPGNNDFVGFFRTGATGAVAAITRDGGTSTTTSSVVTVVADTYNVFAFEWDGIDKVRFFVDAVKVAEHNTADDNIGLDTGLVPTFAVANDSATAHTQTIDYVLCMAER